MSNKDQEIVVYLLEEKDLVKPIQDRTVLCLLSTMNELSQRTHNKVVDTVLENLPSPAEATEEELAVWRDMVYLQALGFRASEVYTQQMPGEYITLRVAVVDGPMAGTIIYSEEYPTHLDPAKIRELEGGVINPMPRPFKLH